MSDDAGEIISEHITEMLTRIEDLSRMRGSIEESSAQISRILDETRPTTPGVTGVTIPIDIYVRLVNLTDHIVKDVTHAR